MLKIKHISKNLALQECKLSRAMNNKVNSFKINYKGKRTK